MERAEKTQVVDRLNQTFREHESVLLIDFTGLNVPEATILRRRISESGSTFLVIKNRLVLRAIEDTSLAALKEHFRGPTALAYTGGDLVALAKILKDFIHTHPGMNFKAGIVEGKPVSASDVEDLAGLPSRIELLSKLAVLLNSPLTSLASVLQSPIRNLGSVLKQLTEKNQDDEGS